MSRIFHICNLNFDGAGGLKKSIPKLSFYLNKIDNCHSSVITNSDEFCDFASSDKFFLHSSYQILHLIFLLNVSNCSVHLVPRGAFNKNFASFKKKIFLFILRFICFMKSIDIKIIYLNEMERSNSIFNKTYYIIPNGVDSVDKTDINIQKKFNKKTILFVSRFDVVQKGLDRLHEILSINTSFNEFTIKLYGAKNTDELLKVQSIFKNFDNVFCFPAISGDDLYTEMSESTFHILLSRGEGFPMSCLETLSFGTPQILSLETNILDIIKENNCGFSSLDIKNINIASLTYDEYLSLCENSLKCSLSFNWVNIAQKYHNL